MKGETFGENKILNLRNHKRGVDGFKYIKKILQNEKIKILSLKKNNLDDIKSEKVADIIEGNTSLERIDLSFNNFGVNGMMELSKSIKLNRNLLEIDLSFNNICTKGSKKTKTYFPVFDNLKDPFCNLTSIILIRNKINDLDLKHLGESLKENQKLKYLNLSNNKFSDSGLEMIFSPLKFNKSITKINLSTNKIKEKGAKIILESLCYNKSIININLSKNKINNVGKTIFECFSLNQTLERVDLSNNNLSEEDINCIISSLDKNSSIKMIKLNDNQVEFPILNILEKQNKNLYDLIEENKFFKNSNYINPLLHYFTYNLMINHLNLRRIGISFEDKKNIGLKFISKFLFFEKKLEKLDLSSCALNDFNSNDLFISLHSNNSVKSLDLSDNLFSSSISKQIRKLFVNKTTLTELNISGNKFDLNSTEELCSIISENKFLKIVNFSHFREELFCHEISKRLKNNNTLETVILKNLNIRDSIDALSESLINNSTLKTLVLSSNNISFSFLLEKLLNTNKTLKKIDLSCNYNNIEFERYLNAVFQNNTINHANFSFTSLKNSDVFSSSLSSNTSITSLDISSNYLSNLDSIGEALIFNKNLTELYLQSNYFSHSKKFIESLRLNKTLKTLDLSKNNLEYDFLDSFFEILTYNNTLQDLGLGSLNFSDKNCDNLCLALLKNTSITKLSLAGINFNRNTLKNVLESLIQNHSIKSLDLSNLSFVTNENLKFLLQLIEKNQTLIKLSIFDCMIEESGGEKLKESLYHNHSLVKMCFNLNKISNSLAEEITYLLKCNMKWIPQFHKNFRLGFRLSVGMFLLCLKYLTKSLPHFRVPKYLVFEIIQKIDKKEYK